MIYYYATLPSANLTKILVLGTNLTEVEEHI